MKPMAVFKIIFLINCTCIGVHTSVCMQSHMHVHQSLCRRYLRNHPHPPFSYFETEYIISLELKKLIKPSVPKAPQDRPVSPPQCWYYKHAASGFSNLHKLSPNWSIFRASFSGWPRMWHIDPGFLTFEATILPSQPGPGIRMLPVCTSETQLCGLGSNNQLKPRQWFVCFGEPRYQGDTQRWQFSWPVERKR